MKTSRALLLLGLLAAAAAVSWFWSHRQSPAIGGHVTVYYTKQDGSSEIAWTVSMRPQQPGESAAEHLNNAARYVAAQAVAGPPSDVSALRFPAGTRVRSASVTGSTANVDLSSEVANQTSGVAGEAGAFKALVWTLTALPGVRSVAITVEGQKLATLPGGHLEIDEPLRRSDF